MKHDLSGNCGHCDEIFDKYPAFFPQLKAWFKALQAEHPDAHISCAGRGKIDQETYFERGASKAHYGQSAHNYNIAIDLFQLKDNQAFWTPGWFAYAVKPRLTPDLKWYGAPGSVFFELPHVEWAHWKELKDSGIIRLVE